MTANSAQFVTATSILLVGLGAAAGGVARHVVGQALVSADPRAFPWATLIVNLSGCLAIGLLAPWVFGTGVGTGMGAGGGSTARHAWRWFAMVGVLGGFTTFSTFGLETLKLLQQGLWGLSAGYVGASVLGGLCAVTAGWAIGGMVASR